jgi:hypothetical protein
MTELKDDVWDDPIHKIPRLLVSHRRTGAPEDALKSAVRAPAKIWTSRLAESVGDAAEDSVVVGLDMSTPEGLRRNKAVSVGINDEGTTPARACACRREP